VSLPDPEAYLAGLAQIRDAAQQRAYISNSSVAPSLALIEALSLRIRDLGWKDPSLAEILTETNFYLATIVAVPAAQAYAMRSRAQILHTMRRCAEAQPFFEQAVKLFSDADLPAEAGRTMVTQMENLSYLSRYDEAIQLATPARAALQKVSDTRYLTIIEIVLGNLQHRLRHYAEALGHYDLARSRSSDPDSTAALGLGRAHVLTEMNRFDEALEEFQATSRHCEQHGLRLWMDMAERGVSRMHLHRGNYSTALRMLEEIRRKHEVANDSRRVGLCDIDRAEIYLQLNLFEDVSRIAERALETFGKLGNRYESGLCLAFKGIAEFKLLNDAVAESAFLQARKIFVEERNEIWVATTDLWRAQLLSRQRRFSAALELARQSAAVFEKHHVPVRAANARVLSAQSLQEMNEPVPAMTDAQMALRELEGFHAPWVSYQAFNTLGRLKELHGSPEEAEDFYLRAISHLESLRGNIRLDELRLSFGKDKYQVYENVVNLKLNRNDTESAFNFVERSKSRTLIDLLERNLDTVWDSRAEDSPRSHRIRKIREELNILYSRLGEGPGAVRMASLDSATKAEITRREQELVELLREAGSERPGWATLQSMELPGIREIQLMLDRDELLIEYYSIGDRFQAFVIGSDDLHVVRDVCSAASVRASLKGFNFQLSKFHLSSTYVERHNATLLMATRHHLKALYDLLIGPIAHLILPGVKLIIVPHQVLHYVPFHALFDGENYVIDGHDVSYGASASVLSVCRSRKPEREAGRDLILAVADELTPYINDEVEALSKLMPDARVFVGPEAREDRLREFAPTAGKIHIAAHGIFRADNPMFSSLRLGDNWLNLFDIFNLQLGAEITTLSACETGMNAVWEGDELLGLARGFLYAGTPSLVVSLWMVNDRSTAQMMRRFYEGLRDGLTKANALRQAIVDVKEEFPHPYYWAPFVLLGKS
jgi:CHAT domain-containing protein